jgi:hypothetical protein
METTSESRPWLSVPEAGRIYFGLARAASYNAAKRGELPTIRVGRRLVVPVGQLRAKFGLEPEPA